MGMPHTFDCFGSIYGYEYRTHKWIYDVKFYLNGDMWCLDEEGEKPLRKVEEDELKIIEQHKHIIEEHEKENAAWLAHKQCRKRSCVCKNVKNIVIAMIVWRKLMTVIVLNNKLRMVVMMPVKMIMIVTLYITCQCNANDSKYKYTL